MSQNSSQFVQFKSADPNVVFDLTMADRDLDSQEKEAEEKAERFSLKEFPRINPLPGRLGFLLRNLHKDVGKRNEMVINFVSAVDEGSKRKFIRNLLIWWNVLDEWSKKRVDIFDLFCDKFQINRARLWAVIQEGMFWHYDALTRCALDAKKASLIETIDKFSKKERNTADRKLLAEATGLVGGEAPVINDNRQITNQTLNVTNNTENSSPIPSFADSIRRSDNVVRNKQIEEAPAPLQLEEGEQNYIVVDGFIVEQNEAEKVLAKSKVDKMPEDFERELIESGRDI